MRRALVILFLVSQAVGKEKPFSIVEATIPDLQAALKAGRVTSHELVLLYLARIATYEDKLHAVITVNPRALEEADALDRERAQGKLRGPLHGIPIALKDNIQASGLPTTGGALAFAGYVAPYEATLAKNLRDGGAIVIAKTQLTELANWVAADPPMPNNYNSVNGQGYNPYDPRPDPSGDGRPVLDTGGSSSGAGTAVSFWAASVGTETSGSILSPSTQNMLAAVKPTIGRISRRGVIPITADQDTAGPMARTVTDAAILLGVLEGKAADPLDATTTRCPRVTDYTAFLKKDGLRGARIGVPRAYFYDKMIAPGADKPDGGLEGERAKAMAEAIDVLKRAGAVVVDPVVIPSISATDAKDSLLVWDVCTSMDELRDKKCSIALGYGMERDFNAWLATLGPSAPLKSLKDLRQWNRDHQKLGTLKYGQSILDFSDGLDLETYKARYQADRARDVELTAAKGIDAVMAASKLDALVFPSAHGADIAARPGYPTVIVPFALVPNEHKPPFPDGFKAKPSPFGVSFSGSACSEPTLLRIAYAFEQATRRRVPPSDLP